MVEFQRRNRDNSLELTGSPEGPMCSVVINVFCNAKCGRYVLCFVEAERIVFL